MTDALKSLTLMLLSATALSASPAMAQTDTAQVDALRAEVAALKAQIADLAAKVDTVAAVPAPVAVPAMAAEKKGGPEIKFKGAPEISTADGWSFKPRGRIHFDVGSVSAPGALQSRNLGFTTRVRRVRLGMEGTVPGNFGYKVEADFANSSVAFGDVWLTYNPANAPVVVRIGNFETLNSMEQITGSNNVTFLERNAFNEAFINARRLGAAVAVSNKAHDLVAEVGIFTGHAIDSTLDNDGWIGAARVYYGPKMGKAQLHFGMSAQYRDFSSNNAGTASASLLAPSTNQLARYRARPNSALTDFRFVDTGSFAAKGDSLFGIEAAAIFPRFYVAGEAQWLKTRGYNAGATASGLDVFTGGNSAVVPTSNPGFFGGFAEIGTFLTGETRGYAKGLWTRPKVAKPVGKGGFGAVQVAARYDYLDLNDDALKNGVTNNFTTGTTSLASTDARLGRGGTQSSYLLGVNWYPIDYIRFMLNYTRVDVKGGPFAATVLPLATNPVDQRTYGVDVIAARMQVEF
jgi:phosphate-selective porin OprO and OprP